MSAHSEIHSSTLFNCAVYSKQRMPHIPIKPVKKMQLLWEKGYQHNWIVQDSLEQFCAL